MSSEYRTDMVTSLPLLHQGKVRDCFAVGDDHMLMVASDRLSAFDVVLPDPIPGKGEVLTRISNFWFDHTSYIVASHQSGLTVRDVIDTPALAQALEPRAVVVRKLKPLPLEAIVRGYLIGSGWKDYQRSGGVCGIPLPEGLQKADRLPEILFTPSTKAAAGKHDENVSFEAIVETIGRDLAGQVRQVSIELFRAASEHAEKHGIIIADTKFEFGLDKDGTLCVMDEVLTPDSSRFWPADSYRPGISPPSYDKQFVRDYLETLDWDKKAPGPRLPQEIINVTRDKYADVGRKLVDK